jgi:hypothetical protein
MHRIEIAIHPSFDEIDAAGPFGVLSNYEQGTLAHRLRQLPREAIAIPSVRTGADLLGQAGSSKGSWPATSRRRSTPCSVEQRCCRAGGYASDDVALPRLSPGQGRTRPRGGPRHR